MSPLLLVLLVHTTRPPRRVAANTGWPLAFPVRAMAISLLATVPSLRIRHAEMCRERVSQVTK
jgi:hypothetical protein